MAYRESTIFDYKPLNLSEAEACKPQKVLIEFFNIYFQPSWEQLLTEWLKAAFSHHIWTFSSASTILRFHNSLIRVLEASWLIKESAGNYGLSLHRSCSELFKNEPLPGFRDNLWDMLNASLSNHSIHEIGDQKACSQLFVDLYSFLYLMAPVEAFPKSLKTPS